MGRRKITIKQISDPKLRHITFNKRKNGLIKKAAELAVLCDVNMLLVFEDDGGNLIQFSRDKISTISQFFKECKYSSLLELTANDYPNFFKVNHYKKTKEREKEQIIADANEIKTHKNTRSFSQLANESDLLNNLEVQQAFHPQLKEAMEQRMNSNFHNLPKDVPRNFLIMPNSSIIAPESTVNSNSEAQNANGIKKNKNKLNLKLNIQKEEESDKPVLGGPPSAKIITSPKPRTVQEEVYPENLKSLIEKTPDLLASPFFENFQQFGMIENSPFKFYNQNAKMRFVNRLGGDDLSAILKSTTGNAQFYFPNLAQATPLLKSGILSELDKEPLDSSRMSALFSENRIFNFGADNKDEPRDNTIGFVNLNSAGKKLPSRMVGDDNDPRLLNGLDTKKKVKERLLEKSTQRK